MKKNIFAICDPEADYAYRLTENLSQKPSLPFELHAFTDLDRLLEFAQDHPIELLLLSSRLLTPKALALQTGKLVVLQEEGGRGEEGYDSVYKYQSSAKVLEEVLATYGETRGADSTFSVLKKSTVIYGVYSPLGRCGKTSFALALGQELARRKNVLFLNLEACAGLESLLPHKALSTLSDLLYYARQHAPGLAARLGSLVLSIGQMDLILPVRLGDDIRQASWKDLGYLLEEIMRHTSYEIIVIDVGRDLSHPLPLLNVCDRVFTPILGDPISRAKLSQYAQMLTLQEEDQILEKSLQLTLPASWGREDLSGFPESLLFGPMGEAARQALKGVEI